jgi:PKD repeat protein
MLAANPDLSATEARYILSTTTDKVGGYTYAPNPNQPFGDWNIEMGYGRVNAYKAVLKSIDAITNPTLLADFQVIQRAFCGLPAEVEFVNTSANAVAARWEFEGGTPSVSTDFSPVVTYANVGLYDVKLTVFGANGDSVVLNRLNFISVDDPLARVSGLPLFADFEDPDALFPDDNWEIFDLDDDDFTWEPAAVGAFGESEGSVFMDNYEYFLAFGELDWILPPSIDLSQVDNRLALLFDYAYAQFLTVEDNLIIAYSIDCETSYQLLDFIPGSDLATAPPTMAPFVPNADQWATRVYDLSAFAAFWKARGAKTLNLALINQSNWGNNLYLDNIEVTTTPPPFADFAASDQNAFCENFAVQFADLSAFADAVAWEFPGGTPATSTARNPVVTYSTPGTYDVTLKAMNEQGESILTREGFIVLGSPVSLPLAYDFETPLPGNWSVFNPDNSETLIRVGPGLGAFEKSNFSGVVPNYSYNGVGQRDGLITPAIDVTGVSTLALAFDYAYTFYQEGNFVLTDGLEVYVSTDECAGASNLANYQLIWSSEGADLATAPATNQPFIPEFYEWKRVTVPLDAYLGTNPLRVAILNKNGFGNNLFIDNILIDREILPTINFLSVVDAETNEIVSPMFSEFELSELPASVNFVANVSEGTTGIGSILMGMRGPGYNRSITENVAPYAMFGDNDGDFNGRTMRAGTFDITLTAFTGANRTGTVAEVFRTSLDIVNFSPFNVTAFRWVDANTNQVVGPLPAIIDLAVTGKDINIIAETSEEVGSVVFRLRGSATVNQTENVAPYALFGDVDGDFNAWGNVKVGTYELTATPYPLARGRGLAGRSLTQIFEVVDSGSGMMAAGLNAGFAPVSFNGLDRMVVYPNPARQLFTLEMPDNARPLKAVRVFDMVGRLHFEETTADNLLGLKLDFPVGQLSPGVYLIRAETDGGAYTFRIVKE